METIISYNQITNFKWKIIGNLINRKTISFIVRDLNRYKLVIAR
ncbi:MAG: hypothetical protein ACRC4L_01425 [Mycoplasma sp.]